LFTVLATFSVFVFGIRGHQDVGLWTLLAHY